jgi:hypothetical protein
MQVPELKDDVAETEGQNKTFCLTGVQILQ